MYRPVRLEKRTPQIRHQLNIIGSPITCKINKYGSEESLLSSILSIAVRECPDYSVRIIPLIDDFQTAINSKMQYSKLVFLSKDGIESWNIEKDFEHIILPGVAKPERIICDKNHIWLMEYSIKTACATFAHVVLGSPLLRVHGRWHACRCSVSRCISR